MAFLKSSSDSYECFCYQLIAISVSLLSYKWSDLTSLCVLLSYWYDPVWEDPISDQGVDVGAL